VSGRRHLEGHGYSVCVSARGVWDVSVRRACDMLVLAVVSKEPRTMCYRALQYATTSVWKDDNESNYQCAVRSISHVLDASLLLASLLFSGVALSLSHRQQYTLHPPLCSNSRYSRVYYTLTLCDASEAACCTVRFISKISTDLDHQPCVTYCVPSRLSVWCIRAMLSGVDLHLRLQE
jgi:hypothetical protein